MGPGVEGHRDWLGVESSADDAARLAAYYDLVHDQRRDDVEWCRALAQRTGGPILELGCGTGRVAVPLALDGHRVVGVDRSAAALARADRRARGAGAALRLIEADMCDAPVRETFPLVLMLLNTFLTVAPSDRVACLARARDLLAPAGRLAVHVFQPDPARISGQDGAVVDEGTYMDEEGRTVTILSSSRATVDGLAFTWLCDEYGADHVVRRYTRSGAIHFLYRREAELLFSAAGLEIETLHGDFEGTPVDDRSPHLVIVARRADAGGGGR